MEISQRQPTPHRPAQKCHKDIINFIDPQWGKPFTATGLTRCTNEVTLQGIDLQQVASHALELTHAWSNEGVTFASSAEGCQFFVKRGVIAFLLKFEAIQVSQKFSNYAYFMATLWSETIGPEMSSKHPVAHAISNDSLADPAIYPAYFENDNGKTPSIPFASALKSLVADLENLVQHIKYIRSMSETEPWRSGVIREIDPGPNCQTDEDIRRINFSRLQGLWDYGYWQSLLKTVYLLIAESYRILEGSGPTLAEICRAVPEAPTS
ncbi:hypothetical protein B0H11DRAFT_1923868 [Mycena galericulata]|nr:hypothetical protein B0H11DRAFT_1923868 [Mycena galericulata]